MIVRRDLGPAYAKTAFVPLSGWPLRGRKRPWERLRCLGWRKTSSHVSACVLRRFWAVLRSFNNLHAGSITYGYNVARGERLAPPVFFLIYCLRDRGRTALPGPALSLPKGPRKRIEVEDGFTVVVVFSGGAEKSHPPGLKRVRENYL